MSADTLVLDFSRIDSSMVAEAGGKGANLGELVKTGFPVPEGFCLTTGAWDLFLSSAPREAVKTIDELGSFVKEDLEDPSAADRIKKLSMEVRNVLENTAFPQEISKELNTALKSIGFDALYAVRSSATAEDLPGFSFAGQQDTFLNIRGTEDIKEHVKRCWASLFTERAVMYRIQNGFSQRTVKLAVVVQRMIASEASGILFTADPLTGNRNHIRIDAGFGLGEALVSGLIDPDSYTFDKNTLRILTAQVNEKKLAIYPKRDGGTEKRVLTDEHAGTRVLSDDQITELCTLALRVEDHYETPQDIEWGLEGGKFYLLQARPITTLYPLPESWRGRKDHRIYISLGHIQVMTSPVSPMGRSVLSLFFPFGRPRKPGVYNPLLAEAGERLYIDITPVLTRKFLRKKYTGGMKGVDFLMGKGVEEALEEPGVLEGILSTEKKPKIAFAFPYIKGILPSVVKGILTSNPLPRREKIVSGLETYLSSVEENTGGLKGAEERLIYLRDELENFVFKVLPLLGVLFPALIIRSKIRGKIQEWVDSDLDEEIQAVERGLEGNITTQMDLETGDLTDRLKDLPMLAAFFKESGMDIGALEKGRLLKGSETFYREFDRFMEHYGFRGLSEIDIKNERWKDDPKALLQIITTHAESEEKGAHRAHFYQLTKKAEEAVETIILSVRNSAGGRKGVSRSRKMRKMLNLFRCYMPLREHGKYYLMKLFSIIREELLDDAEQLCKTSVFRGTDDVWFLEYNEMVALAGKLDSGYVFQPEEIKDLQKRIDSGRSRFERFCDVEPPRVLMGNGTIPRPSYSSEGIPEGALIGMGVSAGVVEGRARVITDPGEESLLKGEILIAPFTDPAWTPLFINAAAVVIEVGGTMTHGSVIAREYGIPAVVSIPGVTESVKTGRHIRVNGSRGFVELLD
ncbi:MAG: phosphoenolpyruvate synthase [Spirochaetes bacterium]|nr:MAG: phosphoenolpyruvate synthase [Spirochaetota bacterium]